MSFDGWAQQFLEALESPTVPPPYMQAPPPPARSGEAGIRDHMANYYAGLAQKDPLTLAEHILEMEEHMKSGHFAERTELAIALAMFHNEPENKFEQQIYELVEQGEPEYVQFRKEFFQHFIDSYKLLLEDVSTDLREGAQNGNIEEINRYLRQLQQCNTLFLGIESRLASKETVGVLQDLARARYHLTCKGMSSVQAVACSMYATRQVLDIFIDQLKGTNIHYYLRSPDCQK